MYITREFTNSYEISKLAIESMVDYAIYILNKRGMIISANSGAQNLTGFASSEVNGTHFARFHTMEDISRKHLVNELKITKRSGHYDDENWFVKKNGEKFWANIVLNRLTDSRGAHIGYSAILKDLTSKKKQEDALRKAELSAQKALKLKSQFIADISHEIRTPLGAMLGFAEFLQKNEVPENDRHHYLDIILKNGNSLNRVINDVLDLSKIEAGRISVEMVDFDLRTLLKEVVELFDHQCRSKSIAINFKESALSLEHITSDATRIRQILNNIISNAVKFTDQGEISIEVSRFDNTDDQCGVRISIQDSGIGLNEKEITKLFQPYVQVGCRQKSSKGSGLGLVLSRKMAQALGGNVELVRTGPGIGSVFSLTFTDYKALKVPALKSKITDSKEHSLKSKSILVVDDSLDNLEIIKLFLNSYGGNPDVASDGEEALLKMQSKNYDVVLMDIEMPNMNGFQVIKELRNRKFKTPVIALTAHALPEDRMKTKNAGFFEHVTKPIDFASLVHTIEALH